jgi:hypothetical protein
MTARHILNATVQRLTGRDIRLMGNWDPLPDWNTRLSEISFSLGTTERQLQRCRDIADVLELVHPRQTDAANPAGQIALL